MKVLVLHTLPPEAAGPGRTPAEFDLSEAARGLAEALPAAAVEGVRGEALEILGLLSAHRPDVVFNACEAPLGRPDREAHVASLLEWIGVRFTGSGSETLALCRRKDRANAVLAASGVPVPRRGRFPCIVKPAGEDGSAGIDSSSVCESPEELERAVVRLSGPALVEEFLPGREFVVSLWGGNGPEHASIGETLFTGGLAINTYAAKWDTASADFANSPLSYRTEIAPELREAVLAVARRGWRAVGARGYVRVDVRLDEEGNPRVLDVNPNPELGPDVGINRAVQEAGWSFPRFVRRQVEWA